MKFLVIGLGSMGKRRIRNLGALGDFEISGFDVRQDRREEAEKVYGINTLSNLAKLDGFDAVIISTPPDKHNEYIRLSIEEGKPCFVELSLLVEDLPELNELAKKKGVLVAPSCTVMFHPSVRKIIELVQSGAYGKVTNFTYNRGNYLPDWHPWEDVKDFFVSQEETSGCKELLGFELPWIMEIAGCPKNIVNCRYKAIDLGIDTNDTYAVILKFENCIGLLHIDLVSRFDTRSLIMNLEKAQLRWNIEEKLVRLYDAESKEWAYYAEHDLEKSSKPTRYNWEEVYIDEMRTFVDAMKGVRPFPNSLDEDIQVLKLIDKCGRSPL